MKTEAAASPCTVIDIETLRQNRKLVYLREWLAAQSPWQRRIARSVRRRIRAA